MLLFSLLFVVSSQHPTTSPAPVIEITSSRTEQDDQSRYPLPGAAAADAAGAAGTSSAAAAAPSGPQTTSVPLVDLTASASTPDSLLSHVSSFLLYYFLTIGSATSAPDGSSPRGCVQLE